MNQVEAGTPRHAALPLFFSPAPLARLMRGGAGEKERGGLLCCLNLIHPRGKLVGVSSPYSGISGDFGEVLIFIVVL